MTFICFLCAVAVKYLINFIQKVAKLQISYKPIRSANQTMENFHLDVVGSSWNSLTGRKQKGKVQFLLQLPPSTFVNLLDGIAACWYTANFMPTKITRIPCESLEALKTTGYFGGDFSTTIKAFVSRDIIIWWNLYLNFDVCKGGLISESLSL